MEAMSLNDLVSGITSAALEDLSEVGNCSGTFIPIFPVAAPLAELASQPITRLGAEKFLRDNLPEEIRNYYAAYSAESPVNGADVGNGAGTSMKDAGTSVADAESGTSVAAVAATFIALPTNEASLENSMANVVQWMVAGKQLYTAARKGSNPPKLNGAGTHPTTIPVPRLIVLNRDDQRVLGWEFS